MKTIIFSFFLISILAYGKELPSHCKDLTRAEFERQMNERLKANNILFDAKSYKASDSKPKCDADKIELNYDDFYMVSCKVKPVDEKSVKEKPLPLTIYCADYRSYKNYCSPVLLSKVSDSECFQSDSENFKNVLNEVKCYFKRPGDPNKKGNFECAVPTREEADSSTLNECYIKSNILCRKKTENSANQVKSSTNRSPSGSRFDNRQNDNGKASR